MIYLIYLFITKEECLSKITFYINIERNVLNYLHFYFFFPDNGILIYFLSLLCYIYYMKISRKEYKKINIHGHLEITVIVLIHIVDK